MFLKRSSEKSVKTTAFSSFIQNAKSGEKKKVFVRVLNKAAAYQEEIIRAARA